MRPCKARFQYISRDFGFFVNFKLDNIKVTFVSLNSLEIVNKVQSGELPPFRPTVSELITKVEELRELMKQCWVENPDLRPDFQEIKKIVNKILTNKGM